MKRNILVLSLVCIVGAVGLVGKATQQENEKTDTDQLILANVEALTDDEEDYSGEICYSGGHYDADEPKALVCDMPCKLKPWKTPLWGGKSVCL